MKKVSYVDPQNSSSFKCPITYNIPIRISKILDVTNVTGIDFDIPEEVCDWVNELEDNYLGWLSRTYLVLAYCNPLTSPKALPNLWEIGKESK